MVRTKGGTRDREKCVGQQQSKCGHVGGGRVFLPEEKQIEG